MNRRAAVLVCDGLGVGEAPDAARYGDSGADTLGHVLAGRSLDLPNLESIGLLRLAGRESPGITGALGKMAEISAGKDTTTGHWEMMGLVTEHPFPLYPSGFPAELIRMFEEAIGRRTLGNKPASGTEILKELGPEHLRTGFPIVYTSGDSVFQVAAHEKLLPPASLWEICRTARRLLVGANNVGRVIARPFAGEPGAFVRTANRRDFSVEPHGETFLDRALGAGLKTRGIGKIVDIFAGRGLTSFSYSASDSDGLKQTGEQLARGVDDFIFTNLVDFDSKYGHRNDVPGFAENLEDLDEALPALLATLREDDLLIVTADHGCDPSDSSTAHTREFVPLLVSGAHVRPGADLGIRASFRDLAATLEEWFGLPPGSGGRSALSEFWV